MGFSKRKGKKMAQRKYERYDAKWPWEYRKHFTSVYRVARNMELAGWTPKEIGAISSFRFVETEE